MIMMIVLGAIIMIMISLGKLASACTGIESPPSAFACPSVGLSAMSTGRPGHPEVRYDRPWPPARALAQADLRVRRPVRLQWPQPGS